MELPADLPHLAIVRVLTSGGPYAAGDAVAVAFSSPTVGRLARCRGAGTPEAEAPSTALLPETISAKIELAAGPYQAGDLLTLSFVDPRVARLHPMLHSTKPDVTREFGESPLCALTPAMSLRGESPAITPPLPVAHQGSPGVGTRLSWERDRAQRFVQVCDKLFTVDRLGWYRHALVMRLLIPDEVTCGDANADREAMESLRVLRRAAVETLGRPLLAAFMPNFSVTAEWLDTLDDPATAGAVATLRAVIGDRTNDAAPRADLGDGSSTHGAIARSELGAAPTSTIEAFLPLLIAHIGTSDAVTERLTAYRSTLIELFGQTARSAEAVRLTQMAQPNHILDDRLWQLVGVVSECFGGLAVA